MGVEKVREHLKKYDMDDRIITMDESSATVALAAQALSCNEEDIAKTLSFLVLDMPIVIVTAGNMKIDNSKYKATFHEKAHMIPFDLVEKLIGHKIGGVCPFGLNEGVKVYLDESLKKFDYVYPACGESNNAIKITIPELENITNYVSWVDVCKIKEE